VRLTVKAPWACQVFRNMIVRFFCSLHIESSGVGGSLVTGLPSVGFWLFGYCEFGGQEVVW
jgi:hypothetical protein